jgi:hypothetical protein
MWRCNTRKNIWLTVSKKSEASDVWIGYCSLLKSQKAAKCQECRSGCCHFQTKFDLKNTRMYVCIITWNRTRCLLSHVNDIARQQEIWLLIFVACELQDVQYKVEKVLFWAYFVDQSQNGLHVSMPAVTSRRLKFLYSRATRHVPQTVTFYFVPLFNMATRVVFSKIAAWVRNS